MASFLKNIILIISASCLFLLDATADPSKFPDCSSRLTAKPHIAARNAKIIEFLNATNEGREFLAEVFPKGLPETAAGYLDKNPQTLYQQWYNSLITKREEESRRQKLEEFGVNPDDHQTSSQGGGSGLTPLKKVFQEGRRKLEEAEEKTRTLEEQLRALEEEKQEAQRKAAEVSPLKRNLGQATQELENTKERLKSTEQRIQELETRMGQEAIGAIHDSMPATGRIFGGRVKFDSIGHLQQSYLGMIDDLDQSSGSNVQDDSQRVRKITEEIVQIFADMNENKLEEMRQQAFHLAQSAFEIVKEYEGIKWEGLRKKIDEAGSLATLKKIVIDDIFYDVFLAKMSELEVRILNRDVLEQSLDLTMIHLEHLQRLTDLNTYAPSKLAPLKTLLIQNEQMLRRKIEERDLAIRSEYASSLNIVKAAMDRKYEEYKQQKQAGRTIEKQYNFAFIPVPIQLMRSPLAFFLLAKFDSTDKKFNDIQILDQAMPYMTREETRAFFVYLYDVYENFSIYQKRFTEITLASPPPMQSKDIQQLIKLFKHRLNAHFRNKAIIGTDGESQEIEVIEAEKPNFSPAFNDRKSFEEFAAYIEDLITEAYTVKVIKRQLGSLRTDFNHKLHNVTEKGIQDVIADEEQKIIISEQRIVGERRKALEKEKKEADVTKIETEINESKKRIQMLQKTLNVAQKFTQLVTHQGGIDAIQKESISSLKELMTEMKTTWKEMDDKGFPIRQLTQKSTDFVPGKTILESAVVVFTPLSVAKLTTPIKRPTPPRRGPAIALAAPSATNLNQTLNDLTQQLEKKKESIDQARYIDYQKRIQGARDNVANDALQQAQMKITKLQKDLK